MTGSEDERKTVQKWQKTYQKGKKVKSKEPPILIYPHYHCIYCNSMIEKGEAHREEKIQDKNYPGFDHICIRCVHKLDEKEKKKPWYRKMRNIMIIGGAVAAIVIIAIIGIIFWPK